MAVCRIVDTGATPEEYGAVRERLGMGDGPPPGASFHLAAKAGDGKIRIVEIWDSREAADAFTEKVREARLAEGIGGEGAPPIEYLEIHKLIQA